MPLDSVVSLLRFMILGSGLCVVGSVGGFNAIWVYEDLQWVIAAALEIRYSIELG